MRLRICWLGLTPASRPPPLIQASGRHLHGVAIGECKQTLVANRIARAAQVPANASALRRTTQRQPAHHWEDRALRTGVLVGRLWGVQKVELWGDCGKDHHHRAGNCTAPASWTAYDCGGACKCRACWLQAGVEVARFEPGMRRLHNRLREGTPLGKPLGRRLSAESCIDYIECSDSTQRLNRNRFRRTCKTCASCVPSTQSARRHLCWSNVRSQHSL